ncbi:hypothetical protein ACJMK2_043526 [Sinanodonta woodiana]|uniref:G-protein coupled receptors family 1 profile domain-containing protein n=1 Tax=Sinanodonta woodiana TaxID=1069815 RepID=A0ABD3VX71_SINWO
MATIDGTNGFLYESSMANDTIPRLDTENKYEVKSQLMDFLTSAKRNYQIVLGLITVTGLVGNILTVAVILRNKGIKSNTDILILTLAVTDILIIVFCVPRVIVGDYQI